MSSLHNDVEIVVSTTADGSVRASLGPDEQINDTAMHDFLRRHHSDPARTVLLRLSYDTDDFCRYYQVAQPDAGAGLVRPQRRTMDALVTRQSGVSLVLPIADCIGAVLYHPPTHTLMLSHLGRHNLEQQGGSRSVAFLARQGIDPSQLLVYLGPAAGRTHYPLFAFDNQSLHDVAQQQLTHAGVLKHHITVDTRDTVTDPTFFSHSAALRGEKPHGRHAIVCRVR